MTAMMMKALTMLNAHGARYRIELPDGTVHGDLVLLPATPPRKKKRPLDFPMGTLKNHVQPYLENLKVGEIAVVPCEFFKVEVIQNACLNFTTPLWGKGSTTTAQNTKDRTVEVLRLS
jgi:hypothetical protein